MIGCKTKPNPFADVEVQIPLTNDIDQWIFERTGYVRIIDTIDKFITFNYFNLRSFSRFSSYIKKVIDDNNQAEGTAMLLKVSS